MFCVKAYHERSLKIITNLVIYSNYCSSRRQWSDNRSFNLKKLNWVFTGIGIIYIALIVFPQFIFANKLEYKNFTVYYHSNEINREELKSVLDKSEELLNGTELFKKEMNQNVFVCSGFSEFTFFALMSRKSFSVNYPLTQNIFLSKPPFSNNSILRNEKINNKRTLSAVIAHETTHSFLENNLGIIRYKLLPSWKNEGYCDFIAKESSYNEQKGLKEICMNNENRDSPSFKYFRYKTYVKYLFRERKIALETFLNDDFDLEKINEVLKKKYCKQ